MPHLPPEWITHLTAGASHRVASCTADGRPGICRGLAAESMPDGRLRVLVARDAGPDVLDAVQATGQVAVVLGVPGTYRTLHVKGRDAVVSASQPGDQLLLSQRFEAFMVRLEPFGFSRDAVANNWYTVQAGGLFCVTFTISGAWDQSPGPGAGQAVDLLP